MFSQDVETIDQGADVYARDGRWIGIVDSVIAPASASSNTALPTKEGPAGRWLEIGMGIAHPGKALYVPGSAVACACSDWVMLDVATQDLEASDWHKPPTLYR